MNLESYLRAAALRLAGSETPLLDARVIAKFALSLDDAGLILAANRRLAREERMRLDALIDRRARGEPVAYITGEKEFYGLSFRTAPGVLVPRPDTETLIEAARALRPAGAPLRILDLGTGTGCIACALLSVFPLASGTGVDIDPVAAALAAHNARRLGLAARSAFLAGDWLAPLSGRFDLVAANPPYIPAGEAPGLPAEVRDHESWRALFAGADGLDAYRALAAAIPAALAPGGLILLELGLGQDRAARRIVEAAFPDARIALWPDLAGRSRVLSADLAPEKK
jgi:release factor glutamine methyltransferase